MELIETGFLQYHGKKADFPRESPPLLSYSAVQKYAPNNRNPVQNFTNSGLLSEQRFCALFPITTLGIGPPYIWSSLPKFGQGMMFGEYVGILGKKSIRKK
ncbi:hypothetical protein [Sphingorhabdus sp. YGSMI21]|uniref:hypothetical protein n=1 Tax=Sphingorhabdus sp. YGSMI21 TaxID=2077182 RepID=UPI0013DCC83D|nr:hypothetical protein [Sphingorhabdus sp. YGSMI21]